MTSPEQRTSLDERTPVGSTPILSAPDILQGTRHWRDPDEESDEQSSEKPDLPLFQLGNASPSAAATVAAATANDTTNAGKKRGFLQKFSIRARWATPKRRDKLARQGQEITEVDFRETYSADTRDDVLSVHENATNEEVEDSTSPLLKRASCTQTAANGRISLDSGTSQCGTRSELENSDAVSENNFLDGSSTGDLFTAVCVNTYADSASESSRSVVSRRSQQSSSPGRPLLSGGQHPFTPAGRRGAVATAGLGAEDDTNQVPPGVSGVTGGVGGVSRAASSASVVMLDRDSPAASEASRTESTLAPPSDVSVTESARHLSANGIGGATERGTGGAAVRVSGDAGQKGEAGHKTTPRSDETSVPPTPAGQTTLVSRYMEIEPAFDIRMT